MFGVIALTVDQLMKFAEQNTQTNRIIRNRSAQIGWGWKIFAEKPKGIKKVAAGKSFPTTHKIAKNN